ncbi:MAG: hypothetical protein RBR50_07905 [Candidatus Izemoplasmatales bacterium]|jgi:ParB-like chromosome segregation protein Spo0J|nr:hypothetical protein [Candidatus Izemoplasmatales bacterium]
MYSVEDIEKIKVIGQRRILRNLDELKESIQEIGLINPIVVTL